MNQDGVISPTLPKEALPPAGVPNGTSQLRAKGVARRSRRHRNPLPGFGAGMGVTLAYLSLLLIIPLGACVIKTSQLSFSEFFRVVTTPQVMSAYWVTFMTSAVASLVNCGIGLLLAWVLVRYDFIGRRFLDALIDLPFALPTAVAGLVFSALLIKSGWYGQILVPLGIHGAYTRLGIVIVLVFVGLPFVVRTIQPVLESMEHDLEEAAASLGATRWQTFRMILLPSVWPALMTGYALSFARGLGEYGSVIFISGNLPFKTEIAPFMIVAKLEQFAYAEATAIAMVLVVGSLLSLFLINWLERRSQRYAS